MCLSFSFLEAVKRFMKLECKCHGVSGACTIRTCWLAMQDFRRVGHYLKTKYNGATQVMMNQAGTGLIVANKNHKRPTRSDLVYLEASPDYCQRNLQRGMYKHPNNLNRKLPPSIMGFVVVEDARVRPASRLAGLCPDFLERHTGISAYITFCFHYKRPADSFVLSYRLRLSFDPCRMCIVGEPCVFLQMLRLNMGSHEWPDLYRLTLTNTFVYSLLLKSL